MSRRYEDSMLSRGMAWLNGAMTEAAARTVRYARGTAWVTLKAVPGTSSFDTLDADGAITKYISRDWMVETEDLVLSRALAVPQPGDTITEYHGDDKYVFEVNKPPQGECWDWCGTEYGRRRIHTKLISSGSAI